MGSAEVPSSALNPINGPIIIDGFEGCQGMQRDSVEIGELQNSVVIQMLRIERDPAGLPPRSDDLSPVM